MTNLKLTAIDEADYEEIKKFCEFGKAEGYLIKFIDNGNIIFEKKKNIKNN